jgi:hypothetical protein
LTLDIGTSVDQRLFAASQLVLADETVDENVITALGTANV